MTAAPFAEVVGSPYTVWVASVNAAAPALDATDASLTPTWTILGTNGINNQGSGGITVNLGETVSEFTPAGLTLPVKAWRTDEKLTVDGSVVDVTVEQFSTILDQTTITTVAAGTGNPGHKSIKLVRGVDMKYFSLLVRGISPYDDGTGTMKAQYVFTRVYQSGSQSPKYLKGTPAELAWEFTICGNIQGFDPAVYDAQTAAHL